MIWFLLQEIGFWIFVGLTIYMTLTRKTVGLLSLFFWGMTFATCYKFAFTIWFPTKVIVLGMLACMMMYQHMWRQSIATAYIKPFVICFIAMVLFGDMLAYIVPGEYARHFNKFARVFNSSYSYLTSAMLFFYGCVLPRGFIKKVYPQYCLAMEVAIAFGLLHFLCLKAGIEFMPILRQNGSVNNEALAKIGGVVTARIYGVSGEPKSLAFLVCPYVLLQMVMFSQQKFRFNSQLYHIGMILLGVFVLVNTYSSAGLMNIAIATPLLFMFLPMKEFGRKIMPYALGGLLIWGVYAINKPPEKNAKKVGTIEALYDRSFGRAQDEMEDDRQEAVILEHIQEDGIGVILFGYGTAQYTFHVPGQTCGNALIPLQSGLVLTFADFGIIGLAMLAWLFFLIVGMIRKGYQRGSPYAMGFGVAALSSYIGSLIFGNMTSCFIYFMLAIYAYYDSLEASKR